MRPLPFSIVLLLGLGLTPAARAQTSAFTYQGQLTDAGTPVSGSYDLRFSVHDAWSGGAVVGGPLTNAATGISNGLFTVSLDFGARVFSGEARWLEIGLRPAGTGGTFVTLSPRQTITAAPYAVRAQEAAGVPLAAITSTMLAEGAVTSTKIAPGAVSQLGTPGGADPAAVQVTPNGLVGVGTNAPVAGLQIVTGAPLVGPRVLFQVENDTGGYTNIYEVYGTAVNGNLIALAGYGYGAVTLVNIANPASPSLLSQIRDGTGSFTNLGGAFKVAWHGSNLVVAAANNNAVTILSATNPAAPVRLAELRDGVGGWDGLAGALGVAVDGNLVAITAYNDSAVTLMDLSNPAVPQLRAILRDGQFGFDNLLGARGVALSGHLLAVAGFSDNAVTLVDVSTPANPVLRATLKDGVDGYTNLAGPWGVAFSGNLLAISAINDNAVTLVDVSDPASPVRRAVLRDNVGEWQALAGARDVAFSGDRLAITAENAVTLVDVTDPAAPVWLTTLRDGSAGAFVLYGAAAPSFAGTNLVVGGESGFSILGFDSRQSGLVSQGWAGVGTSRPVAPLHVVGNVIVEGATLFDVNAQRVELGSGATASGYSAAALGDNATARGDYSTALGYYTTASGAGSTALGFRPTASGNSSMALGYYAVASGNLATALGPQAAALGEYSVAIGSSARASNTLSVAIGYSATAGQPYAFALGRQAKAYHPGAFVWADSQAADFLSTATNQFSVRANGGVRFTSGSGAANNTVSWTPGGASWSFTSDRNAKDHIQPVDPADVLERVARLPISEWSYVGYTQRHIGPMAQDFHRLFPLNPTPTLLDTGDLHGVALSAIQGLHQKLEVELQRLAAENAALRRRLEALEEQQK